MLKVDHDNFSLVIIGAGGHAVSVANVALSMGYEIKCFIDKNKENKELLGIKIIGDLSELNQDGLINLAIAVGDNYSREKIYNDILNRYKNINFPVLIHESACISFFTKIGLGTVVMPNAVIGPNSNIGKLCIINTQASIDHDCCLQDFSSMAPASVTGGSVEIGIRTSVSISATIKNGLKIGNDCVVGANSFLNKNLSSNQVAYGSPAKFVRYRNAEDPYIY
jgi:sugar O-acyltransferase (sialic acid O-acetyltransferase NeuD family)